MTFYEFLKSVKDEDTPVGDLARDALGDNTFPKTADRKNTIRNYLDRWHACAGAYDALDSAWRRYRRRNS